LLCPCEYCRCFVPRKAVKQFANLIYILTGKRHKVLIGNLSPLGGKENREKYFAARLEQSVGRLQQLRTRRREVFRGVQRISGKED
jgi:hypothetical protein